MLGVDIVEDASRPIEARTFVSFTPFEEVSSGKVGSLMAVLVKQDSRK